MSVVTKKPDFSTCPDCGGKFSPIFQEEETTPRITIKKTNAVGSAFTKSLDSIVLNLTQAMKASKYWDNNQRKNEIDNKNLISKKSSVMINVVDYLESQISFPDRTIIQTDDDKIISIYKFEEEKHKSDVVQIFINKPKLNAISKVREKSSVWIKFHESKVATTTEIYNAALPYVKTIFEDVTRLKGFIIPLEFFEISQGIAEIKEIKYEMYLIIHPRQNAEIRVKDLEAISEEFEEAESNYQTFTSDDNDTDENLEFFDAVDFRPNDPEIICSNIIANLKDYKNNSLKYALTLLEDLVKENQKHRGKKLINPKKIKESLHELHDAFGLYEKRSEMDLQTPERGEGKDVKCFSDILKVLESVTNLVKLQLKEKRMEKESFLDYQSAVSVIKGEDFEIQPKKLKEEMMETFGLLKAYSEKAKRLIKEFKARPKENEAMKESVDCYCQKKCESFNGYFKENVENIEF